MSQCLSVKISELFNISRGFGGIQLLNCVGKTCGNGGKRIYFNPIKANKGPACLYLHKKKKNKSNQSGFPEISWHLAELS